MSTLIVEVCQIENVQKHPNADRLSVAQVKGWNVIIGLDQYKDGDLVTFIPPDCIIPPALIEKHKLEYLRSDGRTKNVKLRGYLSQGLVLDVPEGKFKLGDDVSSVLGITKWQPPEPKYSAQNQTKKTSKKKINPLFDKYTDIENIKHYNDVFKEGDIVCVTEKIHGANSRYANLEISINKNQPFFDRLESLFKKYILKHTHEFVYGSHNVQITYHSNRKSFYGEDVWGSIAKKYNLANVIPQDYIVYGEVFGQGIQDLTYGLSNVDLVVFDIKYKNKYLDWGTVKELCQMWNLQTVPELYVGEFSSDVLSLTDGKSVICPTQIREGIVIKMLHEENDQMIGRKILKSVSGDYLTRKGATEYQ
jgi:RNA ligase (TIGR02306 family)